MGFSRQEYWSGLPFPSPGDLPNPGTEPRCPTLQADASMQETQVQFLGQGQSPGGRHGNRLQYSCLENPMDRGAWRAIVHGVPKSQTRLSNFTGSLVTTSATWEDFGWKIGKSDTKSLGPDMVTTGQDYSGFLNPFKKGFDSPLCQHLHPAQPLQAPGLKPLENTLVTF